MGIKKNSFKNCVPWLRKSSYLATSKSWSQCVGVNQLKKHQLKITKVDYSWIPGKPESFPAWMNHRVSLCWRTNITLALDCRACPRTDVPELWKGQCWDKVIWRRPWGGELSWSCRSTCVTRGCRLPGSPWRPIARFPMDGSDKGYYTRGWRTLRHPTGSSPFRPTLEYQPGKSSFPQKGRLPV